MNTTSDIHQVLMKEVSNYLGVTNTDWPTAAEMPAKAKMLAQFLDRTDVGVKSIPALQSIMTVLQYSYKVKVASPNQLQNETYTKFHERNADCRTTGTKVSRMVASARRDPQYRSFDYEILLVAKQLIQRRVRAYSGPGLPMHGPGTSFYGATQLHQKYEQLQRDVPLPLRRLEYLFTPNPRFPVRRPLETVAQCRLSCVPKDARGPRLVAPHLVSQMFAQQAVRSELSRLLTSQRKWHKCHLPTGKVVSTIQFDDQSINSSLALYASENPMMYGTLDLSDASDRLSWSLVCFLFSGTTLLHDLNVVRARYVRSQGLTRKLHMHAPMGSATCFPVMALTLWALSVAVMYVVENTKAGVFKRGWIDPTSVRECFVFGDDIILPTVFAAAVIRLLPRFGLLPNESKCFYGPGGYRESCGCDAYRGVEITPVRLKTGGVSSLADVTSIVAHCNKLCSKHLYDTRDALMSLAHEGADRLGVQIVCTTDPEYQHCEIVSSFAEAVRKNRSRRVPMRYNRALQRVEARCAYTYLPEHLVPFGQDAEWRLLAALTRHPIKGWVRKLPVKIASWVPIWHL